VWLRHWNLVRDPFPPSGSLYVPTPGHEEAVARLLHAIRSGEQKVRLEAEAGIGKSMVLTRALGLARSPSLRLAIARAPLSGESLAIELARSLRLPIPNDAPPARGWRALADAARVLHAQRCRLVLAIDAFENLDTGDRHLVRLSHLDPIVTLILSGRPDPERTDDEAFSVPLSPLTRGESSDYLASKLRHAGRDAATFTPRALTTLHALADGVPRRLDRLAGLALRASALERLDRVGEELIDDLRRSEHNLLTAS
jgi:hypothetical protein